MLALRRLLIPLILMGVSTSWTAAEWKPHVVRQLNGLGQEIRLSAKLQIVTERWNRVAAVPYLVYMPEKDRLLLLVNRDYGPALKPVHYAMVLWSDDHGATWSEPRPVHLDAQGTPVGMGTSLTYLGQGKLLVHAGDSRWFSQDYGATWGNPVPVGPTPDKRPWYVWDPLLADREEKTSRIMRLLETGYTGLRPPGKGPGYQQGYLRESLDEGRTWNAGIRVPQWEGVSEVALLRAANGDLVAACRTDIPARFKGETLDHYEGLGISISKDGGRTWSDVKKLYDWGRHHPSLLLMPNHDIVMTYVVRKGYVDTSDGYPQFGIEAVFSHDHGQTWDLDHRYLLHTWAGNRKGPNAWWASSQATSSVLLPQGDILTTFGTGYRSQPGKDGLPTPRDVGLVLWHLGDQPLTSGHAIGDAPFDSDLRNLIDPASCRLRSR